MKRLGSATLASLLVACLSATAVQAANTDTRNEPAGAVHTSFSGRLGLRKLKPGSYTLTLSPTDASGNHGIAKGVKFKIVKR